MSSTIRIIQLSNSLHKATSHSLYSEVRTALELGAAIVLVDLKSIPLMNSMHLLEIVKALKLVRRFGHQLFFCSPTDQVRILFELTGLDQVVETFTDVHDFSRHLQSQRDAIEGSIQFKTDVVDALHVDSFKLAS